jgi:hypothetical protein
MTKNTRTRKKERRSISRRRAAAGIDPPVAQPQKRASYGQPSLAEMAKINQLRSTNPPTPWAKVDVLVYKTDRCHGGLSYHRHLTHGRRDPSVKSPRK